MNWQKAAETDLRNFQSRKDSLENIKERIAALRESKVSLKGATVEKAPLKGGSSALEDRLLNILVEIERLKATYFATKRLVKITERGLSALTDEERLIVNAFYVNQIPNPLSDMCERMGYEKTKVYKLRNSALYKFTITCYGLVDY